MTALKLVTSLDAATFRKIADLVFERSGIHLKTGKESLVEARLGTRMRLFGITSYRGYLEHVLADRSGEELDHLIDSISTNVTSFFRHEEHFDVFKDFFRNTQSRGQRRFRVWSAACSSGEEPYSIAMTMLHEAAGGNLDAKILATDISSKILHKAIAGEFDKKTVATVPPELRARYLRAVPGKKDIVAVAPELKRMISFCPFNLSLFPYVMKGPFDAVFCRNVMIYFQDDLRQQIVDEIARLLRPGGYLFVGQSESLSTIDSSDYSVVLPSIYIRN